MMKKFQDLPFKSDKLTTLLESENSAKMLQLETNQTHF